MGCDIHAVAQRRNAAGQWFDCKVEVTFFGGRSYALFGFLAGVRNWSHSPTISEPRGLPGGFDAAEERGVDELDFVDLHSRSWLTLDELMAYNYDQEFEDRRPRNTHTFGGDAVPAGNGVMTTLREFLGPWFFEDLERMNLAGVERIVFGFDS